MKKPLVRRSWLLAKVWVVAAFGWLVFTMSHESSTTHRSFMQEPESLAQEPAKALPKKAQELIAKASMVKSYRVRFTLEAKEEAGEPVRLEGQLLFERPNRRRLEIREGDSEEISQMLVSDGAVEWQYYPRENVVYRTAPSLDAPGPHKAFGEVRPETLRFLERTASAQDPRLRFEAIPLETVIAGAPVKIQILRLEVGEQDGLVRELTLLDEKGEAVLSQRYREVEVNVDHPEGTFAFTPPAGTEIVELGSELAPAETAPAEPAPAEAKP